jgi:uncharacterized protein
VKLNLRELPDGQSTLAVARPAGGSELPGFTNVRGTLTVDKNGGTLRVTGELSYDIQLECSRCLNAFSCSRREPVELFYRPGLPREEAGRKVRELSQDQLAVVAYRGHEVDLWPEVREALLLSMPVKPLCRQDCRGICDQCGQDLNRTACGCIRDQADPRWEALRRPKPAGRRGSKVL